MHHPELGSACDRCEGKEVWAYGTAAMVSLITFCCVFSVALVVEQRWSIHSELLAVGALCVFVFGFVCLSFFWACVDQSDTQERYFYPSLLFVGICGLSTAVLPLRNFKANRRQHMFDRRYIALHVYLLLSTVRKEQKYNTNKQTALPSFLPPCLSVCETDLCQYRLGTSKHTVGSLTKGSCFIVCSYRRAAGLPASRAAASGQLHRDLCRLGE
eukprot:COSAG06_NODE_1643_length_8827_cov_1.799496_9_plen_214_part_00